MKRLQTIAGNGSQPGKKAAWLTCLSALVCAGAVASEPSCGKRPAKGVIVADIALTGPRADEGATPTYYVYAMDGWSRFYVRPADLLRTIDDMIAEAEAGTGPAHAPSLRDLAAEIAKDLPLQDHTDLGKYALRAHGMNITLSYVTSDLLKRGRVSVGSADYFQGSLPNYQRAPSSIRMLALGDRASVWSRLYCNGVVPLYYMQYQIP